MNKKHKIAIIVPVVVTSVMIPVFRIFAGVFGEQLGWYLGLVLYWIVWGAAFPLFFIGKQVIRRILKPRNRNTTVYFLIAFPLVMAFVSKTIFHMEYEKESVWILLMLLSTAFGNGFFEEILWRGVYMALFPKNIFFRIVWPSIWFALWHYAPGSVSSNSNVVGLILGAGCFGFLLSYLAKKTDTIFWGIIAHILGGIVMVV